MDRKRDEDSDHLRHHVTDLGVSLGRRDRLQKLDRHPCEQDPDRERFALVGNEPSPRPGRHTAASRRQRNVAKYIRPCPILSANANAGAGRGEPEGEQQREQRQARRRRPQEEVDQPPASVGIGRSRPTLPAGARNDAAIHR